MGKAIRASALVLLLACSANAGIMQYGVYAPPPPPPPPSDGLRGDGVMINGSPQSAQETTAEDLAEATLVQIALNLLTLL